MEVNEKDLDERLRVLATPPHEVASRVSARALAAPARNRRHATRIVIAASTACALLLVMMGLSYWPHRWAAPPAAVGPDSVGMVLVRAPDGSSVIISTGTPADQEPSGTGYVISEGGHR